MQSLKKRNILVDTGGFYSPIKLFDWMQQHERRTAALCFAFYLARLQSLDPGLTHLLHKQKTVYLVLDDIDV